MIHNVHERVIPARAEEVGMLIDSLASKSDRLWPRSEWPAMRLNGPLGINAAGGHGPVRYIVTSFEPGRRIDFQFTGPAGFTGGHSFNVVDRGENSSLLRHELHMSHNGITVFTWPLFFRPLHDALIEDALDCAERESGGNPVPRSRSLWVKILRAAFSTRSERRR